MLVARGVIESGPLLVLLYMHSLKATDVPPATGRLLIVGPVQLIYILQDIWS